MPPPLQRRGVAQREAAVYIGGNARLHQVSIRLPTSGNGDSPKVAPMAVKKPPATSPARAELSDGPKRGLVRRATQTMESVAAKGVVGFKGMMDRKKLKLQTVKLRPEPSKRTKWILLLLGLDPSRSIWGLRPFDLKWPGRDSEAWWEQVLAAPRTALEDPLSRVPRGVATGRRPPRRRSTRPSPLWSRYALLRGAPRPGPSERPVLSCTHLRHWGTWLRFSASAGAPNAALVGRLAARDSSVRNQTRT